METAYFIEQQDIIGLAVALAIGLLFGLERGWHGLQQDEEEGRRAAGVRTFGLIGLLGGVSGLLASRLDSDIFGLMFLAVSAVCIVAYVLGATASGNTGITSLIAALLTLALGALAALDQLATAASAAVIATLLLSFKPQLHAGIAKLEQNELQATLKLLVMTVVLLPVLPDRGFGPDNALNPFEIWWMVVLIAAISYVGYFAVKVAGPGKGVVVTSLLAGLASSTALTLQMARLARRSDADPNLLGAGILMANATLFPRILVIVGLIQPMLLANLVPPLAAMTLITAAAVLPLWLRRARSDSPATVQVENPLSLGLALRFGAFLVVVMLLGRVLANVFGGAGVLTLAAISGIADLNAITLSVARMDQGAVSLDLAVLAIVLAATSNAVFKTVVCTTTGGPGLGLRVGVPLLAACAAGFGIAWAWKAGTPAAEQWSRWLQGMMT